MLQRGGRSHRCHSISKRQAVGACDVVHMQRRAIRFGPSHNMTGTPPLRVYVPPPQFKLDSGCRALVVQGGDSSSCAPARAARAEYDKINKTSSGVPIVLAALTAARISDRLAMPVDMSNGFFVLLVYSISGKSTNSKEEIL